jgi:urease accessory protein
VRTRVEIVAGRTSLPVLRFGGALALRQTGPATVHLVGTAAGPLGGDEIEVDVHVAAGARLAVRSAAASVVLPGRAGQPSSYVLRVDVDDGGRLDVDLEPTVVAAGARHECRTTLTVAGQGRLRLRERVRLGRWAEDAGRWRGACHAMLDGRPLLRQTIELGPDSPTWDALAAPRALVSTLVVDPGCAAPEAATSGNAILLPLGPGAVLVTATGQDLAAASRDADSVARPCPARPADEGPLKCTT